MPSFLEKLAARMATRREKVVAGFDGLVRAVAEDKPPSPEQAEAVLTEAGKTTEDLAAAVDRLRLRRQARATLDKARAAPAELERIAAAVQAAEAKGEQAIARVRADYAAAVAPLAERQRALEQLIRDGSQAETLLRDTADVDATADRLAALRDRLADARARRDELLKQAHKADRAAGSAGWEANRPGGNWHNPALDHKDYRQANAAESERLDAEAEQARRAAEPHAEKCRQLEKEIEEVENLALAP